MRHRCAEPPQFTVPKRGRERKLVHLRGALRPAVVVVKSVLMETSARLTVVLTRWPVSIVTASPSASSTAPMTRMPCKATTAAIGPDMRQASAWASGVFPHKKSASTHG